MARVRLFANLREIAGTGRVEIAADTVGGVIEAANEKFGSEFERGVEASRVWVNGEEAGVDDQVNESDEVVFLPPVSGGTQPNTMTAADLIVFLPLAVAVVVILANLRSQEIWAATLVAVAAIWALDLNISFTSRGRVFAPLAVATTAVAAALAGHILGGAGYGLTAPIAVAVVLGWGVAFPLYRRVDVFSPTLLAALLGGLGVASLLLSRSSSAPDGSADVFLVSVIVGAGLGALVARAARLPFLDPFSMMALGAVIGAPGAAAIWDLNVVGYLLVGLGVAVALVAGNGLASMLRSGRVSLTERPPGFLSSVDSVMLAAAIYYPLIRVVL